MPRPAKNSGERLDVRLTIRLPRETLDRWQRLARDSELPVSEWLRGQVGVGRPKLGRPRKPPPSADPALLSAIARVGNNLNQLARAANQQQWPDRLSLLERLIYIERALKNLVPANDG